MGKIYKSWAKKSYRRPTEKEPWDLKNKLFEREDSNIKKKTRVNIGNSVLA